MKITQSNRFTQAPFDSEEGLEPVVSGESRKRLDNLESIERPPFGRISQGKTTIPVIGHIPHGSTFIPEDVQSSLTLSDIDLDKELILMTDRYTPELFSGIIALGGLAFVNNYSRLVVDPERFEDDDKEVMSSKGMGAIYTRTAYHQVLRRDLLAKEREMMLSTYFRPYHEALRKEVQKILEQFDRCLIIDCHSLPSKPLPYELDQSTDRPDICIGTDMLHTPDGLISLGVAFCKANGIRAAINRPFAGTYVPLAYLGKDKRVSSIMVEVNRSLYMDENIGERSSRFPQIKTLIDGIIESIIGGFCDLSDNLIGGTSHEHGHGR